MELRPAIFNLQMLRRNKSAIRVVHFKKYASIDGFMELERNLILGGNGVCLYVGACLVFNCADTVFLIDSDVIDLHVN